LDYLAPARLDDSLTVLTIPVTIKGASVELRQSVLLGETILAEAEIQLACVQVATGRPGRIPPRWREALSQMQAEREES
jgi:acyl-CoA thioester hydrolase